MHEFLRTAALVAGLVSSCPVEADSTLELIPDLTIGDRGGQSIGLILEAVEDSGGHLYLADSGFGTIHVFDAEGRFLREISEPGEGPGMLMIAFTIAIDENDRLYIAGTGGRVAIWDTNGNHIDEYKRVNPGADAKSIRVSPNGDVVLAAYDGYANTIVDVHAPNESHKFSIAASYERADLEDAEVMQFFRGGELDVEADGSILYTQSYPFLVQRFSPNGDLLGETDAGGAGWLPEPPRPDTTRRTFSVQLPGASIDVRRVGDHVLNTAYRVVDKATRETLLTLYDADLNLVARAELDGLHSVVGVDAKNRVLIFNRDQGDVPVVTRYAIRIETTEP